MEVQLIFLDRNKGRDVWIGKGSERKWYLKYKLRRWRKCLSIGNEICAWAKTILQKIEHTYRIKGNLECQEQNICLGK